MCGWGQRAGSLSFSLTSPPLSYSSPLSFSSPLFYSSPLSFSYSSPLPSKKFASSTLTFLTISLLVLSDFGGQGVYARWRLSSHSINSATCDCVLVKLTTSAFVDLLNYSFTTVQPIYYTSSFLMLKNLHGHKHMIYCIIFAGVWQVKSAWLLYIYDRLLLLCELADSTFNKWNKFLLWTCQFDRCVL